MTRRSFGALAFAGIFAACSSFGSGDGSPPPPADAGPDAPCGDLASDPKNCGACGNVCGTAKTCVSGACVPGCDGKIVYVSHDSGSDANDGCTPGTAMKSIGAAVAFVSTQNLMAHEIHVCRGTYGEHQLILDHAASLRGAYNCLSWTRADKFGFDAQFQDPNETIVENADYASTSTLDVATAAVGPGVVIEGFTILGAAAGDKSSDALLVRDGASPVLTDLKLVGGATSNSGGFGATALQIRTSANPEVKRFSFTTGASSSPTYGAAGVLVVDAGVNLHDGAVVGGPSAGGGTGVMGIRAEQSMAGLPVAITNVNVGWNGARATTPASIGAIGISIVNAPVTIKGNHVIGGGSTCQPNGCSTLGIQVVGSPSPQVIGNVVYAGDAASQDGTFNDATFGIQMHTTTNAIVADNAVHAGGRGAPATIAASLGIDVLFGTSPTIVGNTVVVTGGIQGGVLVNASRVYVYRSGVRLSGTANQSDGARMARLVGNLVVGTLDMQDFGFQVDDCTGASLAELHDNAFVATTYVGRKPNGLNCASLTTYASATDADGAFGGTNDFVVAPSCTGACAPIVCANATDCASKVFQAWDAATFGSANATSTAGYRLAPGLTCTLAQRTYALPSGATTDVYGAARTSPYSVGAAELDSACMP